MIDLLKKGIICYRIARLIAKEDGPFDMFTRFRSVMGAYDYDAQGKAQSMTGKLVSCPYCTGVWVSIILVLLPKNKWVGLIEDMLVIAGIQTALQSREIND